MHHAKFSISKKYCLLEGNLFGIFDALDFIAVISDNTTRLYIQRNYVHLEQL